MLKTSMEGYRVFLAAAESLNLTKAAEQLHLTQPSVSYAIKQLETSLGVKLFERLSKGVRLTPEGEVLYIRVQKSFAELESAEKELSKLREYKEGQLRIGANGAMIKELLIPLLDSFHNHYPGIRIQLVQESTGAVVQKLKDGTLDLGFVHLPVKDEEITSWSYETLPYCVVVGESFRTWAGAGEPLSAARLAELPLLLLSSGSSTRSFIEGWFLSQGVEIQGDFELNSLDMLAEFAERGYGAAFLPRSFAEKRIQQGKLLMLNTALPLPDREIGIAVRKGGARSLAASAFMKHLETVRE
ncbi:LysR family transcriptional regulator [Paenibacillus sp. JSM ZJ436]|uniref:LysR family transcriptional regulator n=1 Tax=Paenibacillus sp. JSM ZJ436 TaxID=3376190 RepID=UPI003799601A